MNLVILPGNSVKNKEWADKAEKVFLKDFTNIHKQYYKTIINYNTIINV